MSEIKISPLPIKAKPLAGRFGRLVVLGFHETRRGSACFWFRCDCGKAVSVAGYSVRQQNTTSCGCYSTEVKKRLKHGMIKTPEYYAWGSMKTRCNNKNCKGWKHYGGRGIECHFETFEEFFAEVGPRPSSELSIDRINNDGHYEIGNVRWATRAQQRANRRDSRDM